MTGSVIFRWAAVLLALGAASTAQAQMDKAPPVTVLAEQAPEAGKAALRKLRDTLAFDGDPRAIVDARVQIDALLAKQDVPSDTVPQALNSLTGRVNAALAALTAVPRPPMAAGAPLPALPWWRGTDRGLTPLALLTGVSCMACGLAIGLQMLVGRRLLAGGTTAQAAMQAAGKLFESAARRFMQAQDEAGVINDTTLASATQAGQAAARLTGAARDTEARLRVSLDDADGGMRMTIDRAESRLRDTLDVTARRLGATLEEAETRLQACLDQAEARLQGADLLVHDLKTAAEELPAVLEQAVRSAAGAGLAAIEEASGAMRDNTQAVTAQLAAEASALPQLIADAILAVAARGLPAIEAATADLTSRAQDVSVAAGAIVEAHASLAVTQARADTAAARLERLAENTAADTSLRDLLNDHARNGSAQTAEVARIAAAALANTDRATLCLDSLQDAMRAAVSWPACTQALTDAAKALMADASDLAAARAQPAEHGMPDAVITLVSLAASIDATLIDARTAHAEDAAGAALLLEALSARADAALGLLPVHADALAATAAQIREDAAEGYRVLGEALRTDLPAATQALLSAGAALNAQGEGLAGEAAALRSDSADALARLGAQERSIWSASAASSVAMQESAAHLRDCARAAAARMEAPNPAAQGQLDRLEGLLDDHETRLAQYRTAEAVAAVQPAQDDQHAERQAALEGAIARIQSAAARVLAGASAQEQASARVAEAALQMTACLVAAPVAAPPLMSLARLNGLAAEADILHAQADLLATTALRGDGRDLPASLAQDTPALLAAIETSIKRLRGTATALALASDAARAAA